MTQKECVLRSARAEDLPRFIELLKITGLFLEGIDGLDVFQQKINFDPHSIIVLENEEKIIGMTMTTYDPWASFIWHFVIDPDYQGQGLGHLLADEAERRLKMRGTTSVNGYVLPNNKNCLSSLVKRGYTPYCDSAVPVGKFFKND